MAASPRSRPFDPSLPLCEVLEQEYREITGDTPDPAPAWEFEADQILDPRRLATRFLRQFDRFAGTLAAERAGILPKDDRVGFELALLLDRLLTAKGRAGLISELRAALDTEPALRAALVEAMNLLLHAEELYEKDRFEGVPFRSQTVDRLASGPVIERNRLVLEDTIPALQKVYDIRLKNLYRRIHGRRLAALCLSGGGIRSATFALGVLQGLARKNLLGRFHYLSTVSGGGYIGGWLSAWIPHTSLPTVIQKLRTFTGRPLEPEPAPVAHLRSYSSYLSPKLGLLGADTWTLIATYLRNLFLNWLVLGPLLVGALLVPQLVVAIMRWNPEGGMGQQSQQIFAVILALVTFLAGTLAVRYVHANRPVRAAGGTADGPAVVDDKRDQREFLGNCLLPLVLAAAGLAILQVWLRQAWGATGDTTLPAVFVIGAIAAHVLGWALATRGRVRRAFSEILVIAFAGAVGGSAAYYLTQPLVPDAPTDLIGHARYASLAVPLLLTIVLVGSHVEVGFNSRRQLDAAREWSARFSAWLLIVSVGWVVVFGIVILAPLGVAALLDFFADRGRLLLVGKTLVAVLGAVSGAATLRAGQSAAAPGTAAGPLRRLGQALAAPVFAVCLMVGLSWVGGALFDLIPTQSSVMPDLARGCTEKSFLNMLKQHPADSHLLEAQFVVVCGAPDQILGVILGLFLLGLLISLKINTNVFSLHAMYRERLIRAYLGASRPAGEREPNRFTGFDARDNLAMHRLWTPRQPGDTAPAPQPLHVVNVALNLAGGDDLAWRQRKAESFTFTPLHCGSLHVGYRPTRPAECLDGPSYGDGVSLGTAITISGAAASPEMGYHSSPIVSFLLALFNVRLGWWLGNPGYAGRDTYVRAAPASSVRPIVDEALGLTDDKNPYVYLSDGGHFENLALYEMVLRRCHYVVVSDAGCDGEYAFEDLGNALRKIRVDLGIPIDFDDLPIHGPADAERATAGRYCALGRIRYTVVDQGARDGWLLYIKPVVYGGESRDVLNYSRTCPAFPHESTADQFFTESQFESYRQLGSFVIDKIVPDKGDPLPDGASGPEAMEWLGKRVATYLKADPPARPSYRFVTMEEGPAPPVPTRG